MDILAVLITTAIFVEMVISGTWQMEVDGKMDQMAGEI